MTENDENKLYLHCRNCLNSRPEGTSPGEWVTLSAHIDQSNKDDIQLKIICKRCDMNVFVVGMAPHFVGVECDNETLH